MVNVLVTVGVSVGVSVTVGVLVGELVDVGVAVLVGVAVAVGLGVAVGVLDAVGVGVIVITDRLIWSTVPPWNVLPAGLCCAARKSPLLTSTKNWTESPFVPQPAVSVANWTATT